MTRLLKIAAALAVSVGGVQAAQAQPAGGPPAEPRACFYKSQVQNFNVVDDQTLYLRVGVNDIYRVGLMSGCTNLSFRESIGIESRPAGSSICSPLDIEVVFPDHGDRTRCPATSLHHLTPAEAAALPKKYRP